MSVVEQAVEKLAEALTEATKRAVASLEDQVAPLADSYESVMRSAGRRMARTFRERATNLTAAAKFTPPDEDEVAGTERTKEEMRETSGDAITKASKEVGKAFEREGISFDVEALFTQDMLDAIGERAAFSADEELRSVYRDVIVQATDQGWSITRTAEAIVEQVDSVSLGRATALARTDITGMANGASVHVATVTKDADETIYKTWLATDDDRTRESHVEADGQSVLVNESFHVGGAALSYPGDPFGPAEEVMNCRCTVIYGSEPGSAVVTAALDSQPSEGVPSPAPTEEGEMEVVETIEEPEAVTADGAVATEERPTMSRPDPIDWNAVLCVEGEQTEDMRLLEAGSIRWRDLPLTLMGTLETTFGHMGAKVSGRIDSITRLGSDIASDGQFTSRFGVEELAPLVDDKTVRGVSVDLAVFDYEYRDPDTGEVLSDEEAFERWWLGIDMLFVVLDGVIIAATVCPMPAIANAQIAVTASAGLDREQRDLVAAALKEGGYEGKVHPGDVKVISWFTPFDRNAHRPALFAGATVELAAPPRAHFEVSEFPGKTPLTVTDLDEFGYRRVFGHIATWDTCHVGIPGVCTMAPRSRSNYAYFHTGAYPVAEGGTVDIGKLMLGTGHASLAASRQDATRHYDKPDMVGAFVTAHDGEHGIWVSGVARPELTEAGLTELRANPPSGDWRRAGGALELIAVCAVAVPGFPVPRAEANITASAGGLELDALIASSGLIVPTSEIKDALIAAGCGCEEMETEDEVIEDLADLAS